MKKKKRQDKTDKTKHVHSYNEPSLFAVATSYTACNKRDHSRATL